MWVDESGGTETTGTEGTADDLLITVGGEEYSAEINYDIDGDGVEDTAVVEHADGSVQAFIDSDGDGNANEYLVLDEQGETVAFAEYDDASGDWVGDASGGAGGDADAETQTSAGTITADLGDGGTEVGPATVDTDHNGVNDTAVVTTDDGTTLAFTDEDGDGAADVAVEIDANGNAVTYEHSGDGEWTEIDSVSPSGADGAGAGGAADSNSVWGKPAPLEGVARIDAATGQWISQN